MRRLLMTILPLAAAAATPVFAAEMTPQAVLDHFIARFNAGDVAAAAADMAAQSSITDEYAPYHWQGSDAFATWGRSFDADAKAKGIVGSVVTLSPAMRSEVSDDHALIIAPATYRFAQRGVKMIERARITVSLDRIGASWKITSWTWTGPAATPEK